MSETKDWLESLKVGDLVVVSAGTALGFDRVDRVTAANERHVTVSGWKYRRSSGYSTAGGYSRTLLVEPTPARLDAIKARRLREQLRALLTRDAPPLTLEQLTAAARALGLGGESARVADRIQEGVVTESELEAARRVVTLPGWRWMPGMLDNLGYRVVAVGDDGVAWTEGPPDVGYILRRVLPDSFPVIDDPATLGCLEHLVRERFPGAYVVPDVWSVEDRSAECGDQRPNTAACTRPKGHKGHHSSWPPTTRDGARPMRVAGFSVMARGPQGLRQISRGLTRGEALVAALGAE